MVPQNVTRLMAFITKEEYTNVFGTACPFWPELCLEHSSELAAYCKFCPVFSIKGTLTKVPKKLRPKWSIEEDQDLRLFDRFLAGDLLLAELLHELRSDK